MKDYLCRKNVLVLNNACKRIQIYLFKGLLMGKMYFKITLINLIIVIICVKKILK